MKTALVLEGGASRAYFSNGVMDALLEKEIYADYVIGTSAGIANGISYVSRQKGRNLKIGKKYIHDKNYMGLRHLLNRKNRSYYNINFVFDEIPNKYVPFDYDAFNRYKGEVYAAVTDINTGKADYLSVTGEDTSWKTIVATCALPLMFQPVEINGKLYMDGGMTDSIPFRKPIDDGCDRIIVVLTREREYIKKEEQASAIINMTYRKYPKLLEAIKLRPQQYNSAREEIFRLEKENKLLVICPESTKNFSRVESDPQKLTDIYNQGYAVTMNKIGEIKQYLGEFTE